MPKFTVPTLRRFRAGAKRREIADSISDLRLVIQPSGSMSWALRFKRPDGRGAKLTLGDVELSDSEPTDAPAIGGTLSLLQARALAAEISRDRARGIDVVEDYKSKQSRQNAAAADQAANTFGALLREFVVDHRLKKHGTRPRHWRADARLLGLDYPRDCDPARIEPKILPGSLANTWADKPVASIDGHLVHTVVDEAKRFGIPGLKKLNRNVSQARGRKLHAALSNVFRFAQENRKVNSNPTIGVAHPGPPAARERVLTEAERRWFWKACDQIGSPYGPLCQLLLLTGQRLGEVTGMARAEISEDGELWTLPSERVKNHRKHKVPLSLLARSILGRTERIEGPLVFTVSGKKLTGFGKMKPALDQAMLAIARAEARASGRRDEVVIEHWTLHDLRRTAATGMAELGILPHVIEACLNHVSGSKGGVAGIYNRATYAPEMKAALERWAAYLDGLVSGRSANVTPLRPGQVS